MEVKRLCFICGAPAVITCMLCGRPVCDKHQKHGICIVCLRGRVADQSSKPHQ